MSRLPIPGGDNGNWGVILNDYLSQALKSDGTIKDNSVTANTIAPNSITSTKIASDAIGASQIADGSITNALIANGTIQESKLAAAVQSKLNAADSRINVRDFGAVGDGVTDDAAAIKSAQNAMSNGDVLFFPSGSYRFATQNPAGSAAIVLNGLSNIAIVFEPGAKLLMDNLDANGHGTSGGIRITGKASNITLLNTTVEWKVSPSDRSYGDGLRVLGYPSDSMPPQGWTGSTGAISHLTIINHKSIKAPQSGTIIMGCSDVTILGHEAIDTHADGLHFNATRRLTVNGHHAMNTGDDGLAFVNYYHATQPWLEGPTDGEFNQSSLNEWSNTGSVSSVVVAGNRANGMRVQMARDLAISDVQINDKDNGYSLNSAKIGPSNDWQSLASRNVIVSNMTITANNKNSGIVLGTNLIDANEDPMWWDFSGCKITNVTMKMTNVIWAVSVETPDSDNTKFSGITLQNIYAEVSGTTQNSPVSDPNERPNGGIRLASLYDSIIDNIELIATDYPAKLLVTGAAQQRTEHIRDNVTTVNDGVTVEDLPASNLSISTLIHRGPGQILIQDIAGISAGDIAAYNADGIGVTFNKVKDVSVQKVLSVLPGRGSGVGRGANVLQSNNIDIAEVSVETDDHVGSLWQSFEIGGGDANYPAGNGIRIEKLVYTSTRDDSISDFVVQTGPYAPADWYVQAHWRHSGETSPKWRFKRYGTQESNLNPATWINGPVDFDSLTTGGVFWVAGAFLDGAADSTYHQPADNIGVIKLTVTVADPDDTPTNPLDILQEYVSKDHPELRGQRRKHAGQAWTAWVPYIGGPGSVTPAMLSSDLQGLSVLHNPPWIEGPVDFDSLTTAGIYMVAGSFLNGNPTTYNQPGNTGIIKLTVTVSVRGSNTIVIQEYISMDAANHGGQRRRYEGTWSGWASY